MYVLQHVSWVVITESQNDYVWKGLLEVILSGPLAHAGPSGADCTSLQTSFEYLQGEGFHSLPGQTVSLLINPHSTKVPDLQRESSLFQFMPIASSPVTEHQWKEPSLYPPFRYF